MKALNHVSCSGPGCSSLAGGFMSELGPFYPTPGGKLQKNQHAWNQIANIIFLESPAFVGWSYSNTSTDIVVGEQSIYSLLLSVLQLWLTLYLPLAVHNPSIPVNDADA